MDRHRILVVDDEEDLREILKFNLEKEGYAVDTAASAEEALDLDLVSYDLLLLDIMMGEISGMTLAGIIKRRKETASIPLIFITARDAEEETVKGLSIGADDYITKPFRTREVIARVGAVLRRAGATTDAGKTATARRDAAEGIVSCEGLRIDTAAKRVMIDGEEVSLTKKEFEILLLLVGNAGRVFSRQEILLRVWDNDVYVLDRTVDVNITRLRKKIGEYGDRIRTRQGFGYSFDK